MGETTTQHRLGNKVVLLYLLSVSTAYLVIGVILIKCYRYQMNPDGISYISIAQKYLAGNFTDAVNGYWGPLFSWLLVPFLYLKIEPVLAIRILDLLIGLVTLFAMWRISRQLFISDWTRLIILLAAMPIALCFSTYSITPDLLLTCMLLFYFRAIFQPDYWTVKKNGLLCGLLGAFAFFAKSFALPFFISHFFLMNLLHYLGQKEKNAKNRVIVNFICGIALFTVITGLWIGALTAKYNKFTFSTSKDIRMYQISPLSDGNKLKWYYKGLYAPPNDTAIHVWEDPAFILPRLPRWSPFESAEAFKYYTGRMWPCIKYTIKSFNKFSFICPFICIAFFLILLQKPAKLLARPQPCMLFLSLLLFCGGYLLVGPTERLLWPASFFLVLLGAYLLDKLFEHKFFTIPRKTIVYAVFVISFAVMPVQRLIDNANPSMFSVQLARVLKPLIHKGDSVASNGNWGSSLRLAFQMDTRYYGIPSNSNELLENRIRHFMVWTNSTEGDLSLPYYRKTWSNPNANLAIYTLETAKLQIKNKKTDSRPK